MSRSGLSIGVIDDAGFSLGGEGVFGKEVYAELLSRINEDILGNKVTRILLGRGSSGKVRNIEGLQTPIIRAVYDKKIIESLKDIIRENDLELLHVNILNPRYVNPLIKIRKDTSVPIVLTMHSWYYLCPTGWKIKHPEMMMCRVKAPSMSCFKCINSMHETYGLSYTSLTKGLFQVFMLQRLAKASDALISPSKTFRKHVAEELGITPYYIPNPINPEILSKYTTGGKVRASKGYVLFIGRLEYEKGAHLLPIIAEKIKPIEIHVAGKGRLENYLKEKSRKINNLIFHGYVDEITKEKLYSYSSVVIVPSIWMEMFGFVVVEAFLYRKPVVAFEGLGGPSELIEESNGGVLVKPYDLASFIKAIKELVINEKKALNKGLNGYKWILDNLNPAKIGEKIERVYTSIVKLV